MLSLIEGHYEVMVITECHYEVVQLTDLSNYLNYQ